MNWRLSARRTEILIFIRQGGQDSPVSAMADKIDFIVFATADTRHVLPC
ncbi:MAG: hypothetical protein U0105_05285 [Candidatus Obscuribacterales bacterium]